MESDRPVQLEVDIEPKAEKLMIKKTEIWKTCVYKFKSNIN